MEVAQELVFICDRQGNHVPYQKPELSKKYDWLKLYSSDGKQFRLIKDGVITYIGRGYWVNIDGESIGRWQDKVTTPSRPKLTLVL